MEWDKKVIQDNEELALAVAKLLFLCKASNLPSAQSVDAASSATVAAYTILLASEGISANEVVSAFATILRRSKYFPSSNDVLRIIESLRPSTSVIEDPVYIPDGEDIRIGSRQKAIELGVNFFNSYNDAKQLNERTGRIGVLEQSYKDGNEMRDDKGRRRGHSVDVNHQSDLERVRAKFSLCNEDSK